MGIATVMLIGTLKDSPSAWGNAFETLLLPGATVGMVMSTGGVHGSSPTVWVAAVICGNVVFYTFAWVAILRLLSRRWPTLASRIPRHEK